MQIQKKVIGNLEKCYSLAMLDYQGTNHLLVAAEKMNDCRMYSLDGELEDVIWKEPGGVMSLVPIPEGGGAFLATNRFYSPNDSADASIVMAKPTGQKWEITTLVHLPFVHRFDILQKNGAKYLIACALKSGHEYKDDWRFPGKVYAAKLPEDLCEIPQTLQLTEICDQMLRNHGYSKIQREDGESALISCENGIFIFTPPSGNGMNWGIQKILDVKASDAVMIDLDGCGEEEVVVLSPFHGDDLSVYKKQNGSYEKVYEYPAPLEFLHAIYPGSLCGKPVVFVGNRKGERLLLAILSDQKGAYVTAKIDAGKGPANVLYFQKDGVDMLAAANRETDEIALYSMEY